MRRVMIVLIAGIVAGTGTVGTGTSAAARNAPEGRLVAEAPAAGTPHVLDGRVESIAKVGDTMVLGGTFRTARNDGDRTGLTRKRLLAFDASTGRISTTFLPNPDGPVTTVIPAGDGVSVYVAGSFSTIGGVTRRKVARVRVSDGAVLTGFDAGGVSGEVRDLRVRDGRLWLAGAFTTVRGVSQPGLAVVDPDTGALDGSMRLRVAGTHSGGRTSVLKIDISPDGSRLVAIGNFRTLDGVTNRQLFMLDLTGAAARPADFRTSFYESACASVFNTYLRDLDFSPDGSYFVVSTTGAYGGPRSACDTTARFETGAGGPGVAPSWVDYTGGDTTHAVEITDTAVYTGGHSRWQNNPYGGNVAGPGAVSRPGIAALDPLNGLPLAWNPTRARGVGVFDMLTTPAGLWVVSDTDRIGRVYRGRVALLPSAGARTPAVSTPTLPNDVYLAGQPGAASDPRVLFRVNAGGPRLPAPTGIAWAADTAGSPSPHHNQVGKRRSWGKVRSTDGTVPRQAPRALFTDELADPAGGGEQSWDFPVAAGTPVEVRLYFASRCGCTAAVGDRVFNVKLDGDRVLRHFDIVAAAGHDTGTVRKVRTVSDGTVDVLLRHVRSNPVISAVEVVRTDLGPPPPGTIARRPFTGDQAGPSTAVPSGGLDWNRVRGAFMLNGWLYVAGADGSFTRRPFDGVGYGTPVAVDTADEIVPLRGWHDELASLTGMFYDSGRIYYTRSGSDRLHYRYFSPHSDVVGARRLVASGNVAGLDLSRVRGMFTTGTRLFSGTPDGSLKRIDWAEGSQSDVPVGGTATVVSGPSIDGQDWSARALFLFQDGGGNDAGRAQPTVTTGVTR